jgi:hypothetical protein
MKTSLVALAGILALAGCRGDDGDSDGGSAPPEVDVQLADDFSEGFPGGNWVVRQGFLFVDEDRGNSPPGLVVGLFNNVRIESSFTFSTSEPVTFLFDLETPGVQTESDSRFKLRVRAEGIGRDDASFEVNLKTGEIRFEILGQDEEFDFFTDADFRTISFSVDQGVATWFVNGQPFMSRGGFPEDHYFVEMEGSGGATMAFVVDNVQVTHP